MLSYLLFFFFNDTATTEIYTLSLHDALPISARAVAQKDVDDAQQAFDQARAAVDQTKKDYEDTFVRPGIDRKSTRLNSSHDQISYAVFCLKKKKITYTSINIHRYCTARVDSR